jgi:hypothetical protein
VTARSPRRARAAPVVLLVAALVALVGAPASASVSGLSGNAQPALPASLPSKVAVVAQGAPVGADVAVLVYNGASRPVRKVHLTGTATLADGTASMRSRTSVVVPSVIAPGAFAVARVGFGKAPLALDDTVKVKVRKSRTGGSTRTSLTVRESELSRPMEGPIAQQLSVTLANERSRAVRGHGLLGVMCFGEAGDPVLTVTARVPKGKVAAGATTTTLVDLPELCPSYLVGLSRST